MDRYKDKGTDWGWLLALPQADTVLVRTTGNMASWVGNTAGERMRNHIYISVCFGQMFLRFRDGGFLGVA